MEQLAKIVVAALVVGVVVVLTVTGVPPSPFAPNVAEPEGVDPPAIADIPDPVAAGEPTPDGFRQLLARDGIEPIYHPVHVDADEVDWDDDTLVLGVAVDDDAVAYPIRPLNRREIVNDTVGGEPIVASW